MSTVDPKYPRSVQYDEQSCNTFCDMNPPGHGVDPREDYLAAPCDAMDPFGGGNGASSSTETASGAVRESLQVSQRVRKSGTSGDSNPHPVAPAQCRKPVIIHTYSPKIIQTEAHNFMQLVQKLTGWGDGNEDESSRRKKKKKKKQQQQKVQNSLMSDEDDDDDDDLKNSGTNSSVKTGGLDIGKGKTDCSADPAARHAVNSGYADPFCASSNKRIMGIDINNIEYSRRLSSADRFTVPCPDNSRSVRMGMVNVSPPPARHHQQYMRSLRNLQISAASAVSLNPMLSGQSIYAANPQANCSHNFPEGIMNPSSATIVDNSCANYSNAFCPASLQQSANSFPQLISSAPSNFNMNYMSPGLAADLPMFSPIAPPAVSFHHALGSLPCKQPMNYFQSVADHDRQSGSFINPNSHDRDRFVETLPSSSSLGINENLYNINSELLPQIFTRDFECQHERMKSCD